jgi:D-lactate dehydrogenase
MNTLYFYDTTEEDKKILEQSLSKYSLVFYSTPISIETISEKASAISVFVTSTVTREMIEKMPDLKLISCRSAGYNNIDIQAATERNITVVTVPSYGEHTVAEYAFSLLLSLTRRLPETVKIVKDAVCLSPNLLQGMDLYNKTIGIIGTGKIGKRVIDIAKGFGMNVIAYDLFQDTVAAQQSSFSYVSLEELYRGSDVISLHAPLTQENTHLLSDTAFSQMKQGVYIINTARGELIDTKALILALEKGIVGGVGLDVVEGEKLLRERCSVTATHSHEDPHILEESFYITSLLSNPRVILTPHTAYNTKEAIERILATTSDTIQKFFEGTIINEIQPQNSSCGRLVLVRHTESEWNARGIWTGSRDAKLSIKGFEDARLLGDILRDITFQHAYASQQIRTMETLSSLLGALQQPVVPVTRDKALNERDYGEYTGKNKHEMKKILGDDLFEKVRRGWNTPIPQGETLKHVYQRIVPYYLEEILPRIRRGENILIVSHGNALRALMKYIESISDEEIENTEMMFGGAVTYILDNEGRAKRKDIRTTSSLTYDTHI